MGTSSGLRNSGIYGQQDWQRRARDAAFSNAYMRGLQMQTTNLMNATPMQSLGAVGYAESFLPKGSTLSNGMVTGNQFGMGMAKLMSPEENEGKLGTATKMPSISGQEKWWLRNSRINFPSNY